MLFNPDGQLRSETQQLVPGEIYSPLSLLKMDDQQQHQQQHYFGVPSSSVESPIAENFESENNQLLPHSSNINNNQEYPMVVISVNEPSSGITGDETLLQVDINASATSAEEEKVEHEAAILLLGEDTILAQQEEHHIQEVAEKNTLRTTIIAHLLLIVINVLFSGFSIASKIALTNMHPLILLALRYSVASPLMLIGVRLIEGPIRISLKGLFMVGILGFFGIYLPQILFFEGLSLTTSTDATIFQMITPPMTAVIAVLLKRERATIPKGLGVLAAFVGALLIIGIDGFDMNKRYLIGNCLIIVMTVFSAFYYLFQQKLVSQYPPLLVSSLAFCFATIFCLGTTSVMIDSWKNLQNEDVDGWIGFAYVTLFGTVFAYLALPWCLKKTSPLTATSYTTIQPLLAGFLASFFLGEQFNYFLLIGGTFILLGLVLVAYGRYKEQKQLDIANNAEQLRKEKEMNDHLVLFELDPIQLANEKLSPDSPTSTASILCDNIIQKDLNQTEDNYNRALVA